MSRREAKRRLGVPEDAVMLLSVARPPKFHVKGGPHFVELHAELLAQEPNVVLCALGAEETAAWKAAGAQFGDRVRAVPQNPDTGLFFQAADIYVDSFPIVSITSLLEAGSWGLPLVSYAPYGSASAILRSDAPGLDDRVLYVDDPETYARTLLKLSRDGGYRERLGEETGREIRRLHTGYGWLAGLEAVYARASRVDPARPDWPLEDNRSCGEPDIHLPQVFGQPVDPNAALRVRLRALPLRVRASEWRRLRGRGGRITLTMLLPEWLHASLVTWTRPLRRRGT
jgi:hypothetical protein